MTNRRQEPDATDRGDLSKPATCHPPSPFSAFSMNLSKCKLAAVVLLTCLQLTLGARKALNTIKYLEDERFPGWKGEVATLGLNAEARTDNGAEVRPGEHRLGAELLYGVKPVNHGWMTFADSDGEVSYSGEVYQLSAEPRAFLYKNFVSEEECDFLIAHSKSKLQASTVVDNKTGKSVPSTVRTSYGTHFEKGENGVVRAIEQRIADVTMLPVGNGEPMQILRYEHGQKYDAHQDYFHDDYNQRPEIGGQRVLTVLMYLATVEDGAGGETVFPSAKLKNDTRDPAVWSACARRGLAVKAVKGDAVIFYSIKPDGVLDKRSLHGSCPTFAGEKWSATKWIRADTYGGRKQKPKPVGGCHDEDIFMCRTWATNGECENNPGYMLENCRKSCNKCNPTKSI